MRTTIILLIITVILGAPSSRCLASERLRVDCPAAWPGAEQRGAKLSYANGWVDAVSEMEPEIPGRLDPGEAELDCAYGHGGQLSPLRITVIIPGHDIACFDTKGRKLVRWCETTLDPGDSRNQIRWFMAEPVTPATRLLGFGLDGSVDQSADGFTCTGQPGGDRQCRRGPDEITLRIADGRTSAVEWRRTDGTDAFAQAHHALALRFGLLNDETDPPHRRTIWHTPGQPVDLAEIWDDGPPYARLSWTGPDPCPPDTWLCATRERMFGR